MAERVKRLPTMQKTQVPSLGQEDPLEKEMAPHSCTLAWKIPWMEEHGAVGPDLPRPQPARPGQEDWGWRAHWPGPIPGALPAYSLRHYPHPLLNVLLTRQHLETISHQTFL